MSNKRESIECPKCEKMVMPVVRDDRGKVTPCCGVPVRGDGEYPDEDG